jgi:hypothetical protein
MRLRRGIPISSVAQMPFANLSVPADHAAISAMPVSSKSAELLYEPSELAFPR